MPSSRPRRIAARRCDELRRHAFLVVEQRLQQVLLGHLLVGFADGDGLRGLQKAFGAVGELLKIHNLSFIR